MAEKTPMGVSLTEISDVLLKSTYSNVIYSPFIHGTCHLNLNTAKTARSDYSEALKLGEVPVTYGRVMMIGPGGAGKSSLLRGLKNERLPENAESTLLVNTSLVKYGWEKAGGRTTQPWTDLGEEDEVHELASYLSRVLSSKAMLSSAESAEAIRTFRPTLPEGSMIEAVPLSSKYDGRYKAHVESMLRKARQKISGSSHRKAEVLLYVWDSGGQIVFLDVLPAFLTSRTLFFLVFNSSVELSKKLLAVTRCKGVITNTQEYHLSTLEILLQWMASIHSHLGPHSEDGMMRPYPKVLLVGTHNDRLSSSEVQANIAQLLQSQYENKSYADLLMPFPLYFVDNTKAGKGDNEDTTYKKLRECVHHFASDNLTVRTPVSWVLFRKVVQMISQENEEPVISYEEALTIADACSIPANALPSVLNFYHELGVVLYYPAIAALQQILVVDPQWLINQFAKLLSPHGFEDQKRKRLWVLFRNKGIVVGELYNDVLSGTAMKPQQFLELLEHFHLAASIKTRDVHPYKGREYFIPSMICTPPVSSPAVGPTSAVEPLHVVFATNYVPPGCFVRLLTAIARKPDCKVLFKNINRYRVDFALGDGKPEELTVFESPCYISLTLSNFSDPSSIHVHNTCLEVLALVRQCLDSVSQWLPGVTAKLAFRCKHCPDPPHFVLFNPIASNKYLRCQEDESYRPTSQQLPWLLPIRQLDQGSVSTDSDCLRFTARPIHGGLKKASFEPEESPQARVAQDHLRDNVGIMARQCPSDTILAEFPECRRLPPLGLLDLQYVLRVLHDVGLAAKWRAIGQTLTICDGALDGFDIKFKGDPDLCLLQVVATWLRGQTRLQDCPSWQTMVSVIADPSGGDLPRAGYEVAKKLKDNDGLSKFIPTTTHAINTLPIPLLAEYSGVPRPPVYSSAEEATTNLSTELSSVARRWLHIGLLLGIKFCWLEQRERSTDDQQNLRGMLKHWLNSLGNVTLQRLIEAVEHSAGGKSPTLAGEIKMRLTG